MSGNGILEQHILEHRASADVVELDSERPCSRTFRRSSRPVFLNALTKQTGPAGKRVNRLYLEDGATIAR